MNQKGYILQFFVTSQAINHNQIPHMTSITVYICRYQMWPTTIIINCNICASLKPCKITCDEVRCWYWWLKRQLKKKGWQSRIFSVSLCWRHCCRAQFITITSPWVHFNTIWEGPLRPSTGCKKLTIDCKRLWRMCRTPRLHRRANRQIIAVSSHFLANNPQVLIIQIQIHFTQIISVSSPKTDNANTQIYR